MDDLNVRFHALLDRIYDLVEPFGTPIAVFAWLTVFLGAIGMGIVLRRQRRPLRPALLPAAAIGGASLLAHLLDYAVTLRISPDLGLEANPVWRIVIERWGVEAAKVYGLSGKLLLSILATELFAFYLVQRDRLFPERATGFVDFWRRFGERTRGSRRVDWSSLANVSAFCFALLGPFFFYVALLNRLVESPVYSRFPPLPLVLAAYLGAVTASYFLTTYRAARGKSAPAAK